MTYVFNPTAGIPKTSFGEKDSPSFDNATWFSTVQPPQYQLKYLQERSKSKTKKD